VSEGCLILNIGEFEGKKITHPLHRGWIESVTQTLFGLMEYNRMEQSEME
jgi:hypothetical protein